MVSAALFAIFPCSAGKSKTASSASRFFIKHSTALSCLTSGFDEDIKRHHRCCLATHIFASRAGRGSAAIHPTANSELRPDRKPASLQVDGGVPARVMSHNLALGRHQKAFLPRLRRDGGRLNIGIVPARPYRARQGEGRSPSSGRDHFLFAKGRNRKLRRAIRYPLHAGAHLAAGRALARRSPGAYPPKLVRILIAPASCRIWTDLRVFLATPNIFNCRHTAGTRCAFRGSTCVFGGAYQ